MKTTITAVALAALTALCALPAAAQLVSIDAYLPANCPTDGSVDLTEQIQSALAAEPALLFPGSNDPANPRIYATRTGLETQENAQIVFGPNSRLLRLPSDGVLITLAEGARISGAIIDGNKYSHWPEFQDLGKNDVAIKLLNHCVVEDCVVFNHPGIAFFTYGSYNRVYRCLADRDQWSGDGFYFRGTGNLIKDCEAYDTIRWDYCSSHSGARQNTYVDCRGGDVNFRTYGFIDLEGSDANNRLIRCISPNSSIAIPGAPQTEVIECMASSITFYDHQNPDSIEMYGGQRGIAPRIDGCITTQGGIVIGGWSSLRDRMVPGAIAPMVTNNRMYKSHSGPSDGYSDWSFSVASTDGSGVVTGNILFEFDDGYTKGPGMNLENVEGSDNQVVYGQWQLDLPKPKLRYGYVNEEQVTARKFEYFRQLLAQKREELGVPGEIVSLEWLPLTAQFIKDPRNTGEDAGWQSAVPDEGDSVLEIPVGTHWDFSIGRYSGVGWYYLPLQTPEVPAGDDLYLYISGIDSEAKLFINGELIGNHEGWDTPSLVRIPDELRKPEQQLLTLKVYTPGGMGGVYGPLGLVLTRKGA